MPRPNNVNIGVAVLVVNDSASHDIWYDPQLLLIKRRGAHCGNTWAGIGGWVDVEDRSPVETCQRELFEEVGLEDVQYSDFKLRTITSEFHEDLQIRTVTIYYELCYDSSRHGIPVIKEFDKCSAVEWFKRGELPSPLFPKLELGLKTIGF